MNRGMLADQHVSSVNAAVHALQYNILGWQDKSRDVQRGRSKKSTHQRSHLARCAPQRRDVPGQPFTRNAAPKRTSQPAP
jgi:hypothetical protein